MALAVLVVVQWFSASAEPIVITGEQVPELLGKPVNSIRLCSRLKKAIPFQIDEMTLEGEYICDRGKEPNTDSSNGILDPQDEIVFLREDCEKCVESGTAAATSSQPKNECLYPVTIDKKGDCFIVYYTDDSTVQLSSKRYIKYDHAKQYLQTPRYYAEFGTDRFHFVRAGISINGTDWIDLTHELRVEIYLRALWGLIPIHFTEDNLICFVKRYKEGSIRLIRRGDFHLRLGLGIKGSRAAVNQICYPNMVRVPVTVHIPFRFKRFFKNAYIEMSPVIGTAGEPFIFSVPECGITEQIGGKDTVDSIFPFPPAGKLFTLLDNNKGYGWVLLTDIPDTAGSESGFIFRRPSTRMGVAECGYRLSIQDVPKGHYAITNWVLFSRGSQKSINQAFRGITRCAVISTAAGNRLNNIAATYYTDTGNRNKR